MAEQEPPTYINGSGWLFAFDEATQQRLVDAARPIRRLCAIRSPDLEAVWAQGRPIPERALVRFIGSEFEPREHIGKFVVMARRGG
jgi:hypothetical protein